jgi:hypothetical protein
MRSDDLNMTESVGSPRRNDTSTSHSSNVGRAPNAGRSESAKSRSVCDDRNELSERFFFVHLQKTGGTTLIHRLPRRFRQHEIYPDASDGAIETAVISVDHLRDRWRVRGHEIRIVTGHFPLCTSELLGTRWTTMTVLRDPVERTLSYLRHHREATPIDRSKSLEEIYDDPFRFDGLIHNHMVKMLSLTVDTMTDGALTRANLGSADLARAEQNLEAMDVVGLQERFRTFWDELRLRFGWQLGEPMRSNQTENVPVSNAFRERIKRDNELDAELYHYARDLCFRREEIATSTHRVRIG